MSRFGALLAVLATAPLLAQTTTWTTGTYSYDGTGNIKSIAAPAYTDTFLYDPMSRLIYGGAGAGHYQEYTYDRFGNIKTITTDGNSGAQLKIGVSPTSNRADDSSPTYNAWATYDADGRVTSYLAGNTFGYDPFGMPNEATIDGARLVYAYTASDERIGTISIIGNPAVKTGAEWTLRDVEGKILRRFSDDENGVLTWREDYIYRDGQLLAAEVDTPDKTLHFHLDHLGTPRLITGNGGVKIAEHMYYPFGREVTSTAQDSEKRKFTGHERDASWLDYMHARYYGPMWGRFLSVDPGPSDLRKPQTWNRYVYAENNPVKNADPDGRLSNPVTGEVGHGNPILHRGGGFGQIRKEQPNVRGSAGGEFGAPRAGNPPRKHKGVDIIAPGGTPLVAAFSGKAYEIRENDKKLGLSVFVQGKDGIIAIYSHLSSTNLKEGETVKEGQQVGEAGRSGNVMKEQPASEDHVHFQLYGENGKVTDPEAFLNDPKKQEKYRDKDEKDKKDPQ